MNSSIEVTPGEIKCLLAYEHSDHLSKIRVFKEQDGELRQISQKM